MDDVKKIKMKKILTKSKKKKFILKEQYSKSWDYIKSSKRFIFSIILIFGISFLIGIFFLPSELISQKILEFIKEILAKTEGMSHSQLMGFILFNNIQSSFMGILLGIFFGIFPIFSTIINGYLLGFVSNLSIQNAGILSLWRILPHGIFELPAIFLSFGLGLRIGISIFNQKKFGKIEDNLISCLRVFIFVVIPLLIIAAIIEGTLIFLGA